MPPQIVVDTSVFISALRSKRGPAFKLISLVGSDLFEINVSVPLILEYEHVAKRQGVRTGLSDGEIEDIIDYLCTVGNRREVFFLWRPFLKDPHDDLVLELAVEAGSAIIVTFNVRDFVGADQFGVRTLTPHAFLKEIGELP